MEQKKYLKLFESKRDLMRIENPLDRTIALLDILVEQCPNPTQKELRGLLSLQAVILNHAAVGLLSGMKGETKIERKLNMVMKLMTVSQSAIFKAAILGEKLGMNEEEGGENEIDISETIADLMGD